MLKVHVAERLAMAAGLLPQDRPLRRPVSLGLVAVVLAAAVALMALYAGVRELSQRTVLDGRDRAEASEQPQKIAPAAGPERLMSIEEMRRLSGQN